MTAWRNFEPEKKNKYHNSKASVDGIVFDSTKEARRYRELKLLESAGEIKNLERQVKYILVPAQREAETVGKRGKPVMGRVIERECSYVADFVYTDKHTGQTVVEDTKGMRTKDYIIKRKLMLWVHGIKIVEV